MPEYADALEIIEPVIPGAKALSPSTPERFDIAESTYIKKGDRFRRFGVPIVRRTVAPTPSGVSTAYTFLMTLRETFDAAADMFVGELRKADGLGYDEKKLISGFDSSTAQRARASDASTSKKWLDALDIRHGVFILKDCVINSGGKQRHVITTND